MKSVFFCTSALLGQNRLTKAEAEAVAPLLSLNAEETLLLQAVPHRGETAVMPPSDPLIYRFYELVMNYGETFKAVIEEEFGALGPGRSRTRMLRLRTWRR